MPEKYVGAIDQGTTSSRFILFDREGRIKASNQVEHKQVYPQPGYVEHDPLEIWNNTRNLIVAVLEENHIPGKEIAALGITNQRETTVLWNPKTGHSLSKCHCLAGHQDHRYLQGS